MSSNSNICLIGLLLLAAKFKAVVRLTEVDKNCLKVMIFPTFVFGSYEIPLKVVPTNFSMLSKCFNRALEYKYLH